MQFTCNLHLPLCELFATNSPKARKQGAIYQSWLVPDMKGQFNQAKDIKRLLDVKKPGFFIEAGAADGENLSNTLFLEIKHKWTGLLVEAGLVFGRRVFMSVKAHFTNTFLLRGGRWRVRKE